MPHWLPVTIGASIAFVAILLVAPLLPAPTTDLQYRIAVYASQLLGYAVVVAITAAIASRWHVARHRLALAILATFILAMACNVLGWMIPADLAKVWFGAVAGAAFVRAVERPWWLLPISTCVPLADAWSVYSSRGVTNAVLERAREEPRWIDWPTIATPIAGYDYESFGRLGTVDILFAGLFIAAAWRWRMHVLRVAVAILVGLLATTAMLLEVEGVAIPALPMICIAFLAAAAPALVRDARTALRERDGDPPPHTR